MQAKLSLVPIDQLSLFIGKKVLHFNTTHIILHIVGMNVVSRA